MIPVNLNLLLVETYLDQIEFQYVVANRKSLLKLSNFSSCHRNSLHQYFTMTTKANKMYLCFQWKMKSSFKLKLNLRKFLFLIYENDRNDFVLPLLNGENCAENETTRMKYFFYRIAIRQSKFNFLSIKMIKRCYDIPKSIFNSICPSNLLKTLPKHLGNF